MSDSSTGVIAGIDCHLDQHVVAVLDPLGRLVGTRSFPANSKGYAEVWSWMSSFGTLITVGVESTGAYGAALTRHLRSRGARVIEVNQPHAHTAARRGKDDHIDAEAAARKVLSGEATAAAKDATGIVESIRQLTVARSGAVKARTAALGQLGALGAGLGRIRQVRSSASVSVRYDGVDETDKIVALGGLGPLAEYADRLGLSAGFASAVPYRGAAMPVVDRGGLLVHSLLMLNAGGDCCTDLGMLHPAGGVLGDVGSETTFRRMITDMAKTAKSVRAVDDVMRKVRTRVWAEHGWSNPGHRVIMDIDATLTPAHSEKEDAKGNYKRGFGFHPVACFADCSGEALAVEHRPGNAGANTIVDLVGIIDAGLDALPETVARSHRPGANAAEAANEILVRSDSAGHTLGFLWDMSDRNLRFCVTGRSNNILSSVILAFDENTNWENALRPRNVDWDGNDSDVDARAAQVVEVTHNPAIKDWVGLKKRPKDDLDVHYPPGTRIVIRREPLHPGAQQRMFDTNGWRHTIIVCDLTDDSPLEIDQLQREHAHVEENIKRLKTTGLDRFPFPDTARNKVWTAMVGWAHTLCRWFQLDLLAGTEFEHAHPKKLRRCLFGTPAILRTKNRQAWTLWPKRWPWNPHLRTAGRRLRTMNPPTPLRI